MSLGGALFKNIQVSFEGDLLILLSLLKLKLKVVQDIVGGSAMFLILLKEAWKRVGIQKTT